MKPITLDYQGLPVLATRDGWFNATQIAETQGKRLDVFFKMQRTQKYIHLLAADNGSNPTNRWDLGSAFDVKNYPELIKTKRGNNGGTWLHPDLMVIFARFISLEFEIWCDKTIKALLVDGKAWQPARKEATEGFKLMNEAIMVTDQANGKVTHKFTYMNEARLINRVLTGKWAGLDREALSKEELKLLKKLELRNAALYMMGKSAHEREQALLVMAQPLTYLKQLKVMP